MNEAAGWFHEVKFLMEKKRKRDFCSNTKKVNIELGSGSIYSMKQYLFALYTVTI